MIPIPKSLSLFIFLLFLSLSSSADLLEGIGYRIGTPSGYTPLKTYNKSTLYRVDCAELDDSRPIFLAELVGSHYEVGYAYAALLGQEIVQTYHTFLFAEFSSKWEIRLLQTFLTWQFNTFMVNQVPIEFMEELRGLHDGGVK
jgi:hypothetical protein